MSFVGDSTKFNNTVENVDGRLRGFGKTAQDEGRRAGEGFDRAADGADNAEGKAQGFASTLTGTKDVMSATGEIARGNYFEGLVLAGQGAADLAEGLNYTVIPAVKAAATAFTKQSIATVRDTTAKAAHAVASKAATVATYAQAVAQRVLNAAMRANPIGIIITVLALLVAGVVLAYKRSETFRRIVDGAFKAVKNAGQSMWNGLRAAFNAIRSAMGNLGSFVAAAARNGFLGPIPLIIARWGSIVSFVRGIPGRIRGALSGAGSLLLQAGRNIVQGLIDGITSRVSSLVNTVSSLAQRVRDFLPFSPAKEGPLSGKGSPFLAGRRIVEMLSGGIRSARGDVNAAMAGALAPVAVGVGGAGGATNINVTARTNADAHEIAKEVAWNMRTSGR